MQKTGRAIFDLAAKFVFLGTFPIWFPILLLTVLFVSGFNLNVLPRELRLKRRMRSAGRLISPAHAHWQTRVGTLILDSPDFNRATSRLWWTPENVMQQAPAPHPSDDPESQRGENILKWHSFDRWCTNRYLCPEHGSAHLIGVW